jgi:hypothetical protein
MHGSAKGAGGQKGEANGSYRDGANTNERVALRQAARRILKEIRDDA